MRKLSKTLAFALAVMMIVASLAACGGSQGGGGATTQPAGGDQTQPQTQAGQETAPDSSAEIADTMADKIVVSANTDITNMNPWVGRNTSYNIIIPEVYELMGSYDKNGGEFHGVLMESWEQVDEKTFRCKLYENIYDQAGNHLTAEDVVFSCEKCWEMGELAETAVVEEVKAIDEFTVEYTWKSVPGIGGFEVVMSNIYIVTKAAYEASNDMITDPVGTGPYKLVDYVSGSKVVIEATGNYWQDPEKFAVPTQYSNVKTIECQVITESAQVTMALQTGAININNAVGTEDLPQFDEGGQYHDKYGVFAYPANSGVSIMANCAPESKLNDINLRLAVFYAIDRDGVNALVAGGKVLPNASFGGISFNDYNPKWDDNNIGYDVDLAKEYLSKSAYPDGCELQLNVNQGNTNAEEAALAMQEYLNEIGITLNISIYPIAQYLPLEADPTAWDLGLSGFSNSSGYIVNSWSKYFDKNTIGRETTKNFIDDPALQDLMDTCLSIEGHTEENLDAFMDYMVENAVMKGLFNAYSNIVYDRTLIEEVVLDQFNSPCLGACKYIVE